jgi:hypothetical protein
MSCDKIHGYHQFFGIMAFTQSKFSYHKYIEKPLHESSIE